MLHHVHNAMPPQPNSPKTETNFFYLGLYFFLMPRPYLESIDPFETGNDSRLAMRRFIDDLSSSMYNDSISLSTNFGMSFRLRSISVTRCIRPSSSRRIAAACSSAESSWRISNELILYDDFSDFSHHQSIE